MRKIVLVYSGGLDTSVCIPLMREEYGFDHVITVTIDVGQPAEDILQARKVVSSIYVDEKVKDYIVDIVLATRDPQPYGIDLNGYVQCGASPRATISLTLGARAIAFLQGRGFVTPQDVKDVAYDVLRHRIIVSYEAEAENITSENIIAGVLEGLPVP